MLYGFSFMPKNKEKKSNKLRNYLLGAGAVGLTGLGAYSLLRKKGSQTLLKNLPVEKDVKQLAQKLDIPEKKLLEDVPNRRTRKRTTTRPTESTPDIVTPQPRQREVSKPVKRRTRKKTRRPLDANLEKGGELAKKSPSNLSQVGKTTGDIVPKVRKKLDVNFEPKGDLAKSGENRLVKRLRKIRKKSNVKTSRKGRGKRKLYQREIDAMQKLDATIDTSKPQGILRGLEIKGNLPPAKPTLDEVFPGKSKVETPNISPVVNSQKLLPPAPKLPTLNKQYTRVTVKPFYRNGKLVQSYKRNMLTNIRQQKLQEIRKAQLEQIAQSLKNKNSILNDQTLKDNLQQDSNKLREFLTQVTYDSPLVKNVRRTRVKKPKALPPNPTELRNRQMQSTDEIYAKQEVTKQTQQVLEQSKNKAVHIKTELNNLEYISQQARENIRATRIERSVKRHQIEFQPEKRSQVLSFLDDQISASKEFAKSLDLKARQKMLKSKSIDDTFNEIKDSLKGVTVPTFNRNLNTVANDVKLDKFKRNLDEYLDNPFNDVDHFKNVEEIKQLNDYIDGELIWAKSQLKEPAKRLAKVKDGIKRIELLRKRYNDYLSEATKLNSSKLNDISLNIDNILDQLNRIEIDDVGEEFYKNELPAIRESLIGLQKGESKTWESPFLKNLDEYEIKLKKLEEQFNKRITNKDFKRVTDYIENLNQQKLKLQDLPITKRKLTVAQKSRLKTTELKRKEFNDLIKDFEATETDYRAWRQTFNKEYDVVKSEITRIADDIDSGEILDYHTKEVTKYVSRTIEEFDKTVEKMKLLDKVMSPQSFIDYFDDGIVKNSDKVTLTSLMSKKHDLLTDAEVIKNPDTGEVLRTKKPSLAQELLGVKDEDKITGTLQYLDYVAKGIKEPGKYNPEFKSLQRTERYLTKRIKGGKTPKVEGYQQENITGIETLRKEFLGKQLKIIQQLENDYQNAVKINPEYSEILLKKLNTLKSNVVNEFVAIEDDLRILELRADNAIQTLKSYKEIRPIFTVKVKPKTDNITEGLSIGKKNISSSNPLYDVELNVEMNPYTLTLSQQVSREVPTYSRRYKNRQPIYTSNLTDLMTGGKRKLMTNLSFDLQNTKGIKISGKNNIFDNIRNETLSDSDKTYLKSLPKRYRDILIESAKNNNEQSLLSVSRGVSSLEDWINSVEQQIESYKVNKREIVADLYWDMQRNNVKSEGADNIFEHIRSGKLTENEQGYISVLPENYRNTLIEFARTYQEKNFQEFYYRNSIRKYILNLQTSNPKLLPENVQLDISDKNTKNILDRTGEILNEIMGIDGGKVNKHMGMIARKQKEVNDTIAEINRLLQNYNGSDKNVTVNSMVKAGSDADVPGLKLLKLTPFMKKGDDYISLNGRLAVENMPQFFAGTSNMDKHMNILLRKLHRLLGVGENGMPLVDQKLASQIAGNTVTSYDELQALIKQLNGGLYDKSSLNTLLTANRMNFDSLRDSSAELYLYNFALNQDGISNFSQ